MDIEIQVSRRVLGMRRSFQFLLMCLCLTLVACNAPVLDQASTSSLSDQRFGAIEGERLEVSCGQCQFGMQAAGCDLAVRIEGQSYFIEGTSIDDHGDAHGETGFCNCVREAIISGERQGDRLVVNRFELLPLKGD